MTVRVAVIGYGLAGRVFHAPLIAAVDGLEVAAIVTADPAREAAAQDAYPDAAILADPSDLWCPPPRRADLVVVAAPNRVHVPLAQASLEAGLPVVVDKPLATTAGAIRELLALSERTGTPLTVFQNRRWDSDFLTARRLIDGGDVGTVTRFESRFERPPAAPVRSAAAWRERGEETEGGGLLFDLGSHLIDQALQLFGWPDGVYAELERRRPGAEVDDDAFVALRFPGGAIAHLWMSAVAPSPGPRLRISGSAGAYEHPRGDPQEAALAAGGRPGDVSWGVAPEAEWGRFTAVADDLVAEAVSRVVTPTPGGYERFYVALRDALLGGGPMPVDPYDALRTQLVIDAARASAARGRVVAPDQPALVPADRAS